MAAIRGTIWCQRFGDCNLGLSDLSLNNLSHVFWTLGFRVFFGIRLTQFGFASLLFWSSKGYFIIDTYPRGLASCLMDGNLVFSNMPSDFLDALSWYFSSSDGNLVFWCIEMVRLCGVVESFLSIVPFEILKLHVLIVCYKV